MSNFNLKTDFDLFKKTDLESLNTFEIKNIPIEKLHHFKGHPFKLYEGERQNDMIESIRGNGIFAPLIVRPTGKNKVEAYEILSGHNRFESGKKAGLLEVPCIVRNDLDDEDARLIVTESNLMQRSFTDLSHSERAIVLAMHYEAMKCQGKRNDLILEIEEMVNSDDFKLKIVSTSSPVGLKLETKEKVGKGYGLSRNSVARYIRINKLIDVFKNMVDDETLSIRAGVEISFLKNSEQQMLYDFINENNFRVDTNKAEKLKELSQENNFILSEIEDVFRKAMPNKAENINFKRRTFSNFFSDDTSSKIIEETIVKALNLYFENND